MEVSLLPPKKGHRLLVACMQRSCFYKVMLSRRARIVAKEKKKKKKKKKKKTKTKPPEPGTWLVVVSK